MELGDDFHPTLESGFSAFKKMMFARLDNAAHLNKLDEALEKIELHIATGGTQGNGRLIVSMPPRHGKSLTVSRLFPAWLLGRNPTKRIMLTSYGATLAHRNSRLVRNLMRAPIYRAWSGGVRLVMPLEGSAAVESWDIADRGGPTGGGMDAAGVGGGITGKGADLIIVDDPIKSRAEAENPARRERIWEWFTDDLYTRREPGAAVIIVMTRWHLDDLVGRLLRHMPHQWENLCLPALAIPDNPDDPLKRAPGAPLWPERFPLETLLETQQTLGEYAWAGLYQQQPIPSEGGLFKRANFREISIDELKAFPIQRTVRFWDLAMTTGEHSDYSVGVLLGHTQRGDLVVLDVRRFRADWYGVKQQIMATARDDGSGVLIGVEATAGGKQVVDQLLREIAGYWAKPYVPKGSKTVRALPLSAKVSAGQVYVIKDTWTEAYLEEFAGFPYSTHDDQVDATAGALAMFDSERTVRVTVTDMR